MRDMTRPSDGQLIVSEVAEQLRAELGRAPTVQEMMQATNLPAAALAYLMDKTPHGVPER